MGRCAKITRGCLNACTVRSKWLAISPSRRVVKRGNIGLVDHQNLENAHRFLRGSDAAEALRIISELHAAGFVAYMAGGCVRDALLGRQPKDYDVATDATPDAIREVFGKRKTLAFGASFGVIGVLPAKGGGAQTHEPTEVATFRSDGSYSDGRRPDSVHFGDAENDAQRRDFTINGLFYDPLSDQVIDYVGGVDDLKAGLLRTIGNPVERFAEDKLRMLRAVRFATTMALQIDHTTLEAVVHHASEICVVSGERIGAEMRRVVTSPNLVQGLRHLQSCGLDQHVFPELRSLDWKALDQINQQYPQRDFARSLAAMVSSLSEAKATPERFVERWKLSNLEVRMADAALKHWRTLSNAHVRPWSEVQPVLMDRDIETIIWLADARVSVEQLDPSGVERSRQALAWPPHELNPEPFLTGDDLRQLGVSPGPQLGQWLTRIRKAQLDGELKSREEAEKVLAQWRANP